MIFTALSVIENFGLKCENFCGNARAFLKMFSIL